MPLFTGKYSIHTFQALKSPYSKPPTCDFQSSALLRDNYRSPVMLDIVTNRDYYIDSEREPKGLPKPKKGERNESSN